MGSVFSLGGSAASMATTAGCCACSSAMSGCNAAGRASKKASAMIYVLFVFVAALLGMIMKTWGSELIVHTPGGDVGCTQDWCHGNESVYRVSFGLVMFFAIALLIAPFCDAYHTGMWGVKFLSFFGCIIGAYLIPGPFYDSYESYARAASSIFLLLQVLILIEFAYDCHEWLVMKADEADEGQEASLCSNWYRVLYIVLCALFSFGSVAGCITMYHYFGCGVGPASISITLLAVLLFTAVSVSEWGRGLLVGSVISIYITWLQFSALTSMPSDSKTCNPFAQMGGDDTVSVWMGVGFAALSVGYAGYSAATGALDALSTTDGHGPRATAVAASEDGASAANDDTRVYQMLAEGKTDEASVREEVQREREADLEGGLRNGRSNTQVESEGVSTPGQIALFHFVMMCCGFYMSMVLTNWADTPDSNNTTQAQSGTSKTSMWVKLISQYVTMGLYTWSIFAPLLFPDRDFS
eukprot:g2322.t1